MAQKNQALSSLESEVSRWSDREAELAVQVDDLKRQAGEAADRVTVRRVALAAGSASTEELLEAEREAEDLATKAERVRQALQDVRGRKDAAETALAAEHNRQLQAEHERLAAPLHAETQRKAKEFIQSVAGLMAPLEARVELATQVAQEFPMAKPISPLPFEELAAAISEAWAGPRDPSLHWNDPEMARRELARRVARWLRAVVPGPLHGGRVWQDAVLKELGIEGS